MFTDKMKIESIWSFFYIQNRNWASLGSITASLATATFGIQARNNAVQEETHTGNKGKGEAFCSGAGLACDICWGEWVLREREFHLLPTETSVLASTSGCSKDQMLCLFTGRWGLRRLTGLHGENMKEAHLPGISKTRWQMCCFLFCAFSFFGLSLSF